MRHGGGGHPSQQPWFVIFLHIVLKEAQFRQKSSRKILGLGNRPNDSFWLQHLLASLSLLLSHLAIKSRIGRTFIWSFSYYLGNRTLIFVGYFYSETNRRITSNSATGNLVDSHRVKYQAFISMEERIKWRRCFQPFICWVILFQSGTILWKEDIKPDMLCLGLAREVIYPSEAEIQACTTCECRITYTHPTWAKKKKMQGEITINLI